MDQKQALNILKANQGLRTEDESLRFVEAIHYLDPNDPSLLPEILYLFRDDVPTDNPQKSLHSFLAHVDQAALVRNLVLVSPVLNHQAKSWLRTLLTLVLSYSDQCIVLIEALRTSSKLQRDTVLALINEIQAGLEQSRVVTKLDEEFDALVRSGIKIVKSGLG